MHIINFRQSDWTGVLTIIFGAGFTVLDVARRIRSTPPTVRAIAKGGAEPRHSQGEYLLRMRREIQRGRLHGPDKK